jgi:serine/threonine protein kinase
MNDTEEYEKKEDSKSVENESPLSGYVLYIQMELCRMTLKEAIIKIDGELNQSRNKQITTIGAFIATQLFHEIVNGVQFLHSSSPSLIMHRDLKPENIYVTDGKGGNFIKIGDFGIATFHNQLNDTSVPLNVVHKTEHSQEHAQEHTLKQGTANYMAPEVFKSLNYDQMCDIYSLGCIGIDLLCINW